MRKKIFFFFRNYRNDFKREENVSSEIDEFKQKRINESKEEIQFF